MKFLQGAKTFFLDLPQEAKTLFLGSLRERLVRQAVDELISGKLTSPTSLDEVCDRLTPAMRKNPLTGRVLKMLGVTDEDLRDVFRNVLTEVGIEIT